MKVRIARRETYEGEFANIEVDVEIEVREGESTQDALERADQEVATRLRFAKSRRRLRGPWWADHEFSGPLDKFASGEEVAP
jgi:hypothetical protein